MRGDDFRFVRHAEAFQHVRGMPHGIPIGLTAHDDADEWLHAD